MDRPALGTEIEVTPEMIAAGLEYFVGVEPFWDEPAAPEDYARALNFAFLAMWRAQQKRAD
jgi:hypothetical protein